MATLVNFGLCPPGIPSSGKFSDMKNAMANPLNSFASNVHSQFGEDGIISRILSIIPENDKWCVEFGAWDGIYLSNVRHLIKASNYSAVLIEGDPLRCKELKSNYQAHDNVYPINKFVGFSSADGLDSILAETPISRNFDFLSIDIDGNDYHVWQATERYRPKVVCIEFNLTIPNEVKFVQQASPGINHGSSLAALIELGGAKGYEAICVVGTNVIFVDRQYFPLFGIDDNSAHALNRDTSHVTWLFSGYDGSVHLAGSKRLLWHEVEMKEERFQALPAYFREYPGNFSPAKKRLFRFLKKWNLLRRVTKK